MAEATCVPPAPGIISWWGLDESSGTTANDRVGNHTAAYSGSPAPAPGNVRGSLRFNGTNYLAVADSDEWAFGTKDFAIEFWANFDAPGGGSIGHPGDIFIGNDEGPGNRNKWFFALGGGFLNFHINSPTVGPKFFPLVPFAPLVGRWYHLAVVRSGTTYTIYIDGEPRGSATNTDAIPNPNAPLTIGQAENLGFMNGRLDEISIYNRALSRDELLAIHDGGTAGKCVGLSIRPDKGGDTGSVSVHVNGVGFINGTTVKLTRAGESDIPGNPVAVNNGGTILRTTFDLLHKPRGTWDVVVEVPRLPPLVLANAFVIEIGQAPDLWADLLGLEVFRPGRLQPFNVLYGNNGNIDVDGVALWITGIPSSAEIYVTRTGSVTSFPDPEIDNDELAPPTVEVLDSRVVGLNHKSSVGSDSGSVGIALGLPESQSRQLELWSYTRGATIEPTSSSAAATGCQKIGCMPPADQDALREAVNVSKKHFCTPVLLCYPDRKSVV